MCDLNKIMPSYIQRKSNRIDEGKIYNELRLSPSPTIISGGQSGIDSVALRASSFLGLPAFAIMPKNGRRENSSIEDFQNKNNVVLRKIELGSESYRFRTYANVYFSDVTVIFDFVNKSEGTIATISACNDFSRPYLLLQDNGKKSREVLYEFLKKYNPRVINFAGNSFSKINEDIEEKTYNDIVVVLRKYCFLLKNNNINYMQEFNNIDRKLTIAIPKFSISENIFKDFLRKQYNIDINYSSKLVYDFNNIRIVVARAREILNLVNKGVDVGFVGEDLCLEKNCQDKILLDTGLIPNNTVLVAKSKIDYKNAKICSQYKEFAKNLLNREDVDEITGSAEAYLVLGFYDACVDTYQTGKTVYQNDLSFVEVLKTTSLVMVGDKKIYKTEFFKKFINYLTELI